MAKHGIVKFDNAGTPTFEARNGLQGVTTGLTTIFRPSEGVVGTPKLVALALAATAGNALATHSATGRIGVSALGRTIAFG